MIESAKGKWINTNNVAMIMANIFHTTWLQCNIEHHCSDYTDFYLNDPTVLDCQGKMINEA